MQPPNIELQGNPSSFVVYASVRQSVLEQQVKHVSQIYTQANLPWFSDSDSEEDADDKNKENISKLPKVSEFEAFYGLKNNYSSNCQYCHSLLKCNIICPINYKGIDAKEVLYTRNMSLLDQYNRI